MTLICRVTPRIDHTRSRALLPGQLLISRVIHFFPSAISCFDKCNTSKVNASNDDQQYIFILNSVTEPQYCNISLSYTDNKNLKMYLVIIVFFERKIKLRNMNETRNVRR